MLKRSSMYFLVLLLAGFSCKHDQDKVSIIFDTDMGPDYDDVGAIALLHALADSNQVQILGTIASTRYEGVAAVLNVFNSYFKRPEIPVGVPKGNALDIRDNQHWSDSIRALYPHKIKTNREATEAIELYRRILSSQPDKSVTIVTVGFLTNLAGLLKSPADSYSKLTGGELVRKKVKNLVSMAGMFPSGREFNIHEDAPAAKYVFDKWPSPVILSGFEIGKNIKTGLPLIENAAIRNSPVQDVFRISIPLSKNDSSGRMSWDQTAVLVAAKGHKPYYKLQTGIMTVHEDGSNTWSDTGSRHSILVEDMQPAGVQSYINKLMQHQPATQR